MQYSYSYLLVAGMLAAASGAANAQAWLGTTDSTWTTPTNWEGGVAPVNGGWIVNDVTANVPAISTAVLNTAADSWIGTNGTGTAGVGVLDINSGGSIDSSTKWLFVGGDNTAGGNGTLNVNSGGIYTSDNQIRLGRSGGTGNLNVDGGQVTVSALDEGGGTVNINITNDGSVQATGGNIRMPIGGGSIDSGSIEASGQIFIGGGVGASTFDMTGGSLSTGSWLPVAIGADSVGTFNFSGGTVNVAQNDGATTIGASANAIGVVNMTGGTWTNGGQGIILGEQGSGVGTFTLDDGDLTTPRIRVGLSATGTGTFNLNGGTLSTGSMELGPGTATVNLNGTPITANADSTTFFNGGEVNLATTTTFDTAGFNVSGDSDFVGEGGIVKNGAGIMSLISGFHAFTGPITINGGGFVMGATDFFATPYAGAITVADGARFGIRTEFADDMIAPSDLAFQGTATTLDIDYNDPNFAIPAEPIQVDGGNFSVSGTITVNFAGTNLSSGNYVLIDYSGATKVGSATWTLGTLPPGIEAPGGIVDTGSTIEIDLVAPAPLWIGNLSANWDNTTANWEDQGTFDPIVFEAGNVATFDDLADVFDVQVTEDVLPSLAKFQNSSQDYTLTSAGGVITGGGGLTKSEAGNLSISGMANTYTGPTTLAGGTTTVDVLANAGVAGPLGAATAEPENLVFGGGTLSYGGAATTFDRGFTVSGNNSGLNNASDLTLTGTVAGTAGTGGLFKTGAGNVNFTSLTENTFGGGYPSLAINEAIWTFDGSAGEPGDQQVTLLNELWVGAEPNVPANLVVQDTVLTVNGFMALSRGNGDTGTLTTVTMNNSTVTTGNFSTGFIDIQPANDVSTTVTVNNSTWNAGGVQQLAESANSEATLTLNGTTIMNGDRVLLAMGENSVADVVMNDTSAMNLGNSWFAVGAAYNGINASATFTLNDSSILTDTAGDFNIGDVTGATGVMTINDMAAVNAGTGTAYIGKNDGTNGTVNVNGGSFTSNGIITVGNVAGSVGAVNVTAGNFIQNDVADRLIVGDMGTGTLSVSGTGFVSVLGTAGLVVGEDPTGNGTVNITSGGLISAPQVVETSPDAISLVTLDGGTLQATASTATFLTVDSVQLGASGGIIDTGANNVTATSPISGAGALTKIGSGTLTLSGSNFYAGATNINEGTLSMTNPVFADGSTVNVATGAILNLTHGGIDNVVGLVLGGDVKPDGDYDASNSDGFITGSGTIRVGPVTETPFQTWIGGFYPDETDPAIVGENADPDGDKQSNKVEYALGGIPNDGGNNAKVYHLTTDRLLLTIAVLQDTPAFSAGPAPSATINDCTYTITGSEGLATFDSAVSVAPVNATGLPDAPPGYKYQTFSLDSSVGLPDRGFMRAEITP